MRSYEEMSAVVLRRIETERPPRWKLILVSIWKHLLIALILILFVVTLFAIKRIPIEPAPKFEIEFMAGEYDAGYWDGCYLTDDPKIRNMEDALELAQIIYDDSVSEDIYREPLLVFYDQVDGVWIVHYWIPPATKEHFILGGGVVIALRADTGELLNLWCEE